MKVKLSDVAKAAGVSVSTVSRVINGDRERPASQATVDKIWQYVKELGYVPNQSAKNLVKGIDSELEQEGKIGCFYSSNYELNNDPFFSCIGIGIQIEMNKLPYNLAFTISTANQTYESLYAYMVKNPVDGVIILGKLDEEIISLIKEYYQHIVYAGVNSCNQGFDEVICDGYEGARMAIHHLIAKGHKTVGYVGKLPRVESNSNLNQERRYSAYCDIIQEQGMGDRDKIIVASDLKTTSAYKAMLDYLEDDPPVPTAFYCANDATAFGVMKALKEYGYQIPKDVAVIGFDNVEMANFVTPTLSSIQVPRRALGSQAVKMLIEGIDSKRDYPMKVNLPFELVVRESSDFRRPAAKKSKNAEK